MSGTLDISLRRDAFARLVLSLAEGRELIVVPVRCFPFTAPTERIALCDEHGREVHCIAELADLPSDLRGLVEEELVRREFIPTVRRICSIVPRAEPTTWTVETDRGPTTFQLTSEDHVRRLGAGALIADAHGVRYRVLDTAQLDAHSRTLLGRYL